MPPSRGCRKEYQQQQEYEYQQQEYQQQQQRQQRQQHPTARHLGRHFKCQVQGSHLTVGFGPILGPKERPRSGPRDPEARHLGFISTVRWRGPT